MGDLGQRFVLVINAENTNPIRLTINDMKTKLTIIACLLSGMAMGQKRDTIRLTPNNCHGCNTGSEMNITKNIEYGTVKPFKGELSKEWEFAGSAESGVFIQYVPMNQSDTVAVWMLVTLKSFHGNIPVQVTQQKGYSVTPRISYWTLPRVTHLNANKERIPDNYIVWMSVQRAEEK